MMGVTKCRFKLLTGDNDTSEDVHAIVTDFILEKHKETPS
jgi:hypothetical protein